LTHPAGEQYPRLYTEHTPNNDELIRNTEVIMLRTILETAAEIASLAMFGSAIALWALALAPMA